MNYSTKVLANAPKEARKKLKEMQKIIRKSAPNALEEMKWGAIAFSYHRILVTYAGFKNHIGFYPTPRVIKAFSKELKKKEYIIGKGSVQFPLSEKLPADLIKKMVKLRVKESIEKDVRWM